MVIKISSHQIWIDKNAFFLSFLGILASLSISLIKYIVVYEIFAANNLGAL